VKTASRTSLLAVALAAASAVAGDAPTRDCALGFAAWCVIDSEERTQATPTRLRVELFAGYKPSTSYYQVDREACEAVGCQLAMHGAFFSLDAFARLWGNPLSDDYFDLGLSYVAIPVVTEMRDNPGFQGELGPVAPGEGDLTYATVRLSLRRPSLFYLVKSKYLVSSFGVGLAFPVARGAGTTFTGADGPKFTLGGRVGAQFPLTDDFAVGLAAHYGVIWYGPGFEYVSFFGAYGLNLQWLLL
jgi:hypothetical protein